MLVWVFGSWLGFEEIALYLPIFCCAFISCVEFTNLALSLYILLWVFRDGVGFVDLALDL